MFQMRKATTNYMDLTESTRVLNQENYGKHVNKRNYHLKDCETLNIMQIIIKEYSDFRLRKEALERKKN